MNLSCKLMSLALGGLLLAGCRTASSPEPPGVEPVLRGHTTAVAAITFNRDGSQLISADVGGGLRVWDVATLREVRSLAFPWSEEARRQSEMNPYAVPSFQVIGFVSSILAKDDLWAVSFEPKSLRLLEVTHHTDLQVRWDVESLNAAVFSADGRWFACDCTAEYQEAMLLEAGTWRFAGAFPKAPAETLEDALSPAALAVSPDGRFVAVADEKKRIKVWDSKVKSIRFTHQERIRHNLTPPSRPTVLAFSPDGKQLISGGNEGIMVWDLATNKATQTLVGHKGAINDLRFSPDGRRLASAGADGNIKLWDFEKELRETRTLKGHAGPVTKIVFSPDGRRLASAGEDKTIRVWELSGPPVSH